MLLLVSREFLDLSGGKWYNFCNILSSFCCCGGLLNAESTQLTLHPMETKIRQSLLNVCVVFIPDLELWSHVQFSGKKWNLLFIIRNKGWKVSALQASTVLKSVLLQENSIQTKSFWYDGLCKESVPEIDFITISVWGEMISFPLERSQILRVDELWSSIKRITFQRVLKYLFSGISERTHLLVRDES